MTNPTTQTAGDGEQGTQYGTRDGFNYGGFRFGEEFPIPASYTVVHGFAYFQGPDGFLWFAPDSGFEKQEVIDWTAPQNVAEFDDRQGDLNADTAGYRALMTELCKTVDAVDAVAAKGDDWDNRHRE
ncbi:hypothetical protein [Micromonospora arborensis]|uniref:hypothetical protein n=1 Tax=Micromonospora arborensis TaxID=2116518 RepID=UPI003719A51A